MACKKCKPIQIPLVKVQALFDPFCDNPWIEHRKAVTRAEIRRAITKGRFQGKPTVHTRTRNIERIAWLVVHGWRKGIEIDVGIPSYACSYEKLTDGWHRLAAAIYRKDDCIGVNITGSLDHAKTLFGIDCNQYDKG